MICAEAQPYGLLLFTSRNGCLCPTYGLLLWLCSLEVVLYTRVCCCGSAHWSVPDLAAAVCAWCLPVYTEICAECQGVLRKGQEIEIRPGIVTKDAEGRAACIPIYSRIITLLAEQNDLQYAVPGGLIGVGTTVSITDVANTSLSCRTCDTLQSSTAIHPNVYVSVSYGT